MQFDANGQPIFDEHDAEIYDYEDDNPEPKKVHPGIVLLYALAIWILTLAAASVSVWVGVDLIGGHDVSFREAVGGGWLIAAIGGYAGTKAST